MTRRSNTTAAILGMPLFIGLLSGVGLIAALLDDGSFDILSWIGLAAPVLIIAISWYRARRGKTRVERRLRR